MVEHALVGHGPEGLFEPFTAWCDPAAAWPPGVRYAQCFRGGGFRVVPMVRPAGSESVPVGIPQRDPA